MAQVAEDTLRRAIEWMMMRCLLILMRGCKSAEAETRGEKVEILAPDTLSERSPGLRQLVPDESQTLSRHAALESR